MAPKSSVNSAVVDDEELLKEFEGLLRAVAGEVGRRSVAPLTEQLQTAARQFADSVAEHVRSLSQTSTKAQQQAAAAASQVQDALQRHTGDQRKLTAEQRQVLQDALRQAEHRELEATNIAAEVRDILDEGLGANKESFDAAAEALWQHLSRYHDNLAADLQVQHEAAVQLSANVAGLQERQAQADEQWATASASLDAHRLELGEHAAILTSNTRLLAQGLQDVSAQVDDLMAEAQRRDEAAVKAVREATRQLIEQLGKLRDLAADQARLAEERYKAVGTGLIGLRNHHEARARETDERLARLESKLDEVLRLLTAPKGLRALFHKGEGQ